jgi:hypothetical protein
VPLRRRIGLESRHGRVDFIVTYEGCAASTPWVAFDQTRPDLRYLLRAYAAHEDRGGAAYAFGDPRDPNAAQTDARAALAIYREVGASPLSRWQVHEFRWRPPQAGGS